MELAVTCASSEKPRLGPPHNVIDELNEKVEILKRPYSDKLRPRALRVVYVSLAMPDLVERAEREGVWVLKATSDVVKPKV